MAYREILKGKRVLLTGGTTGIGLATLKLLAADGARLVTFGRHAAAVTEAVSIAQHVDSDGVFGLIADIATVEGVELVFQTADHLLGDLDILICNAAVGAEPAHEMADADWRYVIETNLVSYVACARKAILRMKQSGGGHLLFVSSVSTDIKKPGESLYAATKAGIEALAHTLRKELQDDNIRITIIQPGSVRTPMQTCSEIEKDDAVAAQEMLEPEDVAEAIHFALTRPAGVDVVNLRIEALRQKRG